MVSSSNHNTYIEQITVNDLNKLASFLHTAGSSLENFRYFNKRDITIIKNHIVTCLLCHEDVPVGYGHLDVENDVVWLGIAVIEAKKGMGFGNMIMKHLVAEAKQKNISSISLSVDKDNITAIRLYKKYGFTEGTPINDSVLLMNLVLTK